MLFLLNFYLSNNYVMRVMSKDAENSALHHWNKLHFKILFTFKMVILNGNYSS